MKKIISILLVLLMCVSAFSLGDGKEKNSQLFIGYLANINNFDYKNYKDYLSASSVATTLAPTVGLSEFSVKNGSRVGFLTSFAVTFPYLSNLNLQDLKSNLPEDESAKDTLERIKSQDFYGLGLDAFLGPGFMLINTDFIKLPIALGLHLNGDINCFEKDVALSTTLRGGLGLTTGVELYLGGLNLFFHVQAAYDFYGLDYNITEKEFTHGRVSSVAILPKLGIGLKL